MKLKAHSINKNNNFIDGWYLPDKKICDNLIKFFESNYEFQIDGKVGNNEVKKNVKNSKDINCKNHINNDIIKAYMIGLTKVIEEYKKKYKFCNEGITNWAVYEDFNIQRYLPTEGFYEWHTERASIRTSKRHLTFMTYLNDVDDDGETEWYYQKLKVKPEKGLTVIWGTDWTFTHRGISSKTQTKYIITGWYSFTDNID